MIDEFIQQDNCTVASVFFVGFSIIFYFISDVVFRFEVEVFLCLHVKITFKSFINKQRN